MNRAGVIALAFIVAACGSGTRWKDMTAEGRTQQDAQVDLEYCQKELRYFEGEASTGSNDRDLDALHACMKKHQWTL